MWDKPVYETICQDVSRTNHSVKQSGSECLYCRHFNGKGVSVSP